jgi:hypothetical protein
VDNGNSGLDILIGPDGPMKKNERITTRGKDEKTSSGIDGDFFALCS